MKIDCGIEGLRIAVRHQPAAADATRQAAPVLYVHGATFGCALAFFWRMGGVSWADTLGAAGFEAFGFDQLGFGESDRYTAMAQPAEAGPCLGRADVVAQQIEAAVEFIRRRCDAPRVHLIAHSWGTTAAALYATRHPQRVDRLVLFAPVTARPPDPAHVPAPMRAWHLVTLEAQWKRFRGGVPPGEAPLLERPDFERWAQAYCASDPQAAARTPPAVQVPYGPMADAEAAAQGTLPYDPSKITVPTLIVRGEWDHWPTDADAQWLFAALRNSPLRRDVKLARGTHLMHIEANRRALFAQTRDFLLGGDA